MNWTNLALLAGVFVAVKFFLVRYILKTITPGWKKKLLIGCVLVLSPAVATLVLILVPSFASQFSAFFVTLFTPVFDYGALQWYRVIFEPLDKIKDIEYNSDLTNF